MVKSVLTVKVNLFTAWIKAKIAEEASSTEGTEVDPRIPLTQAVLDKMARTSRDYYLPALRAMKAFYGHEFTELRREKSFSDWEAAYIDGAMLIGAGGDIFSGQLRYPLSVDFRASKKVPTGTQIQAFTDYLRSMQKRTGNVALHADFEAIPDLAPTAEEFARIRRYFTPEEIAEISTPGVDTPASV